uniref:Carboxylesterase type B domain-containing protein n=1 Tax=Cyclopterus lumpus TaxID=8103 RepID=A0A8C3B184_CYCLU
RITLIVDGVFLTKSVDELFRTHELLTIPFMTGVNNDEGGWLLSNVSLNATEICGMDREHIMNLLNMFYPDVRQTVLDFTILDLLVDDYIGSGEDRVKNRDGYTQIIGDMMFTLPAIRTANVHRGAPVYLYEYQHSPRSMQTRRPSFVGSDHGDEILTVFGFLFDQIIIILEACHEEEEQLSRTMMSYWANFARTGSPNGDGLVHWPKYGAEEDYLSIDVNEQVTGQHLKKDKFVFLTRTLPEKIRQHKEKEERNEL